MYFSKNACKIVFWDVFHQKILIKSYFGMYFGEGAHGPLGTHWPLGTHGPLGTHWPLGTQALGDPWALGTLGLGDPWALKIAKVP